MGYDWDYGSIVVGGHLRMSSYPHAVKLVQVDPYDDYQGGMYYLTWWESVSRKFILANIPTAKTVGSSTTPYAVFVTDGIVERVIVDAEFAAGETIDGYTDDAKDPDYGDNTVHAGIGELDGKNHWMMMTRGASGGGAAAIVRIGAATSE